MDHIMIAEEAASQPEAVFYYARPLKRACFIFPPPEAGKTR